MCASKISNITRFYGVCTVQIVLNYDISPFLLTFDLRAQYSRKCTPICFSGCLPIYDKQF